MYVICSVERRLQIGSNIDCDVHPAVKYEAQVKPQQCTAAQLWS